MKLRERWPPGSDMKRRHWVLALVALLSSLTFLDRISIAVVAPAVRGEFVISSVEWGWVLSAYVVAYSVFEIPFGAMGDRYGHARQLTVITLWWSIFVSATAFCASFWQFFAARFLFGLGAAGAYPNMTGVLYRWMPLHERAASQGVMWAAGRIGGGLAPLVLVPLLAAAGWRVVFVVLGLAGFVWIALWTLWARVRSRERHAGSIASLPIDVAATTEADPINWMRLATHPQLWLVTIAYGVYGAGPWFYFSWFPTWLMKGAGFTIGEMGLFASLPFFLGAGANLVGGRLSDRLAVKFGVRWTYAAISSVCLVLTGFILFALSLVHSKTWIVLLASSGFGVMDLMLPCAWSMCMAIGGAAGGTATALMNTACNLGGFFCTFSFGYLLAVTGSYDAPLRAVAATVVISGLLFALVDCTRGLDPELAAHRA